MSSRDPTKPGRYVDWNALGQKYSDWGLSSGSVLVPRKRSPVSEPTPAPSAKTHTPSSTWSGRLFSRRTATERGAAAVFLVAVLTAAVFAIRYGDQVLIGLAGLAGAAIAYKISRVCSERSIYLFLIAILGLATTAWAEYAFVVGEHPAGALTASLLQWLSEYGDSPTVPQHLDLLATAGIGIAVALLAFFYAQSKKALLYAPLSILVVTIAAMAGITVYQSSFIARYVNVANALGPKTTLEQNAFASRPSAAPPAPKVQSRLPKYAAVNTGTESLPKDATIDAGTASLPEYVTGNIGIDPLPKDATANPGTNSSPKYATSNPGTNSLPKYATVNTGTSPLRLRSCPVTCPIVAWIPKGATVKIVSSGKNGWPEIEGTGTGGAIVRGFVDGKLLR